MSNEDILMGINIHTHNKGVGYWNDSNHGIGINDAQNASTDL